MIIFDKLRRIGLKRSTGEIKCFEILRVPDLLIKVSLIKLLSSIVYRYGDALNELQIIAIKVTALDNGIESICLTTANVCVSSQFFFVKYFVNTCF